MKTLEQLKAENADIEAAASKDTQSDDDNAEIETAEDETQELETDGGQDQETSESEVDEDADGEETDAEAWMQTDEQTSGDNEQSVPVAAHAKMRTKLKGRINEKDQELEALRAEIEALKSGATQAPAKAAAMPREYDFDDDAKFQQAMTDWVGGQVQSQVANATQASTQTAAQAQQVKQLNESIDAHYQRAAKLAGASGITPELYQASDLAVRQTIETALPNMGDVVTDQLIARLGDGSEKVMYFLGRNANAQELLKAKLLSDPSGIAAALYLGELKTSVAAPNKRASRAPKPATQISGDAATTATTESKKLVKKYREAQKAGNHQLSYNTKKAAKAAGLDTSNW